MVINGLLVVDYEYDSQISVLHLEVDEFEEWASGMPLVNKTYLDWTQVNKQRDVSRQAKSLS